jgi:hypothetical protein
VLDVLVQVAELREEPCRVLWVVPRASRKVVIVSTARMSAVGAVRAEADGIASHREVRSDSSQTCGKKRRAAAERVVDEAHRSAVRCPVVDHAGGTMRRNHE